MVGYKHDILQTLKDSNFQPITPSSYLVSKFNALFTQKALQNGTQGVMDSNHHVFIISQKHQSVPKSRLCYSLKS